MKQDKPRVHPKKGRVPGSVPQVVDRALRLRRIQRILLARQKCFGRVTHDPLGSGFGDSVTILQMLSDPINGPRVSSCFTHPSRQSVRSRGAAFCGLTLPVR
jgi:hypothetical protein